MVALLANNPLLRATDLSSLRVLSCGGSPQSPAVVDAAVAALGCEFFLSYGMTEACGKISMSILPRPSAPATAPAPAPAPPADGGVGGAVTAAAAAAAAAAAEARQAARDAAWAEMAAAAGGAPGLLRLVRSSGRPFLPVEVRVVDDAGADVAPGSGAAGEVVVRGPTLFGGYTGAAAAGADAGGSWLQPGGWFRTGDVALDRGDGYMAVVDRKKDMVRFWGALCVRKGQVEGQAEGQAEGQGW